MNTKYEIVNGVIGNEDVSITFASLYITMHTKAIPCTHKPDDPDKQCTVDEDASSEESSNVALPQDIETERSADSCIDSSP
jgi:hypothetical protein